MASSTAADIPTTRGRRKQAKPQRKNVELEDLSSDDVVLTSVAASVGGARNAAGAAGDLCAPPAAAMSPDNNHNHQPLVNQIAPHLLEDQDNERTKQNSVTLPPQEDLADDSGESIARRIFVGSDPGGAGRLGLQGLLMVKVRDGADEGHGEEGVEVVGGDSEVMVDGRGTTATTDGVLQVPQRRPMLRDGLLEEEEQKRLEEYLNRSDTAVIFPEPVEQVHDRDVLLLSTSSVYLVFCI